MRNTEVWHSLGSRCCGHIGRTQLGHALSQFMLFPTQVCVYAYDNGSIHKIPDGKKLLQSQQVREVKVLAAKPDNLSLIP